MSFLRLIIALLGVGLTLLIVFAALEAPINESFGRITQDLWGWTTLADLYLGFILIAVIIAYFEEKPSIALFWILPLFFLGNLWSALWLVLRLPVVIQRLKRAPAS